MYAVFNLSLSMGGTGTKQSSKYCDLVVCLSVELQQVE